MITVKGINDTGVPTADISSLYDEYQQEPQGQPSREPHAEASDADLLAQAQIARKLGATVEITGKWVWATFQTKPEKAGRAVLKGNGWIWCQHKGKWAWRGARVSSKRPMSWEHIVTKYGCDTLKDEDSKELVGVR